MPVKQRGFRFRRLSISRMPPAPFYTQSFSIVSLSPFYPHRRRLPARMISLLPSASFSAHFADNLAVSTVTSARSWARMISCASEEATMTRNPLFRRLEDDQPVDLLRARVDLP
ncbi:MAG: hypothetical protein ACLVB5_05730 [Christensenellales bacterium]